MPRDLGPALPDMPPSTRDGETEAWVRLVRQALEHLYDFPALERHPFAQLPGLDPDLPTALSGQGLRRMLLIAVEALSPAVGTPVHAPDARVFSALHLHYVEGLTVDETARELGLSVRQVYRALRAGEEQVATTLARHFGTGAPLPITAAGPQQIPDERLMEHPRSLDLAAFIERGLKVVERLATQHEVHIRFVAAEPTVTVRCDPLLAHQALVSAFTAALQSAAPGPLDITLTMTDGHPVVACSYIPLADRAQPPALGAAATQLVDQLGWQVAWTVQPDSREALTLTMPACHSTLLVIDDDEGLAQLLDRYLTGLDLRVVSADSGAAGLALAQELTPDVIVLDVMMPDVDGWEVLQTLRTQPETRELPVIICSVFKDPDLAYALGASHFLPKPINREALLQVLRETGVV